MNNLRTVNNIDEQFVAGSTESNSTHFVWRQVFRKYFRYARMTALKISKFDFSATISNLNAQFSPVNKGLNSASIKHPKLFESTSGMREWRHWTFQSLISPLLLKIFMRSLRQWIEDSILHISCCNNLYKSTSGMREWRHWNFQSLISLLLLVIFMRTFRQWEEDFILHVSRFNNFSKVLPVCANGVFKN